MFHAVVDTSPDAAVLLEEAGAVPAAVEALRAREGDAATVAEAVAFFAALVDCAEMVALLDDVPAGDAISPLGLALRAVGLHSGDESVALAGLSLVERVVFFEDGAAAGRRDFGSQGEPLATVVAWDCSSLLCPHPFIPYLPATVISFVLTAMTDLPEDAHIQLLATDVLVYLASKGEGRPRRRCG